MTCPIAALLGEITPFREAFPQAAAPISDVVGKESR